MAFDAHANFADSFVATAPSPAASGTLLTVQPGEGARFPSTPFQLVIAPANTRPSPFTGEVVTVTGVTGDTFTIVRAQEQSLARAILVGDEVWCGPTAKTFTDLEHQWSVISQADVIPANMGRYVVDRFEILNGDTVELAAGSMLEIG